MASPDAHMSSGSPVTLTPFEREDALRALAWVNDPELARAVDRVLPVTRLEHERWYEALVTRSDAVTFSIRVGGEFVGVCGLKNLHTRARHGELWIYLGAPSSRGNGHGSRAVRLLTAVGFDQLNLHRIYLYVVAENEAALRTYRKCGFREEGCFREHVFRDGRYVDAIWMALLRHDPRPDF